MSRVRKGRHQLYARWAKNFNMIQYIIYIYDYWELELQSFLSSSVICALVTHSYVEHKLTEVPRLRSRYSDSLRAGRFGVRKPVVERYFLFFRPVHTGAAPAYCTHEYRGSWTGIKRSRRDADHAPRLRISGAIPLLPVHLHGVLQEDLWSKVTEADKMLFQTST